MRQISTEIFRAGHKCSPACAGAEGSTKSSPPPKAGESIMLADGGGGGGASRCGGLGVTLRLQQ